jgi:hypothetical protein
MEYLKFSQANFKPFQEQVMPLLGELGLPPQAEQEAFSIWLRACPAGLSLADVSVQVISRDLAIGQSGVHEMAPIPLPHTH